MCELFHCTPSEAIEQDPAIVKPIFELIHAESAIRKMNSSAKEGGGAGSMNQAEVDIFKAMQLSKGNP